MSTDDRPAPAADAGAFADAVARLDRARRLLGGLNPLGIADLRLLWLLTQEGPLTLRQIAERLGLEQSTVNRQANAALRAGLLTRSRAGGGAYTHRPSERGAAAYARGRETTLAIYDRGLAALGPERERFLADLTRVLQAVDRAVTARAATAAEGDGGRA